MKSSISSVPILSSLQRSSKLTSDVDSPSDMNVKTRILCTLFSWDKPGKEIKDMDVPLSYFSSRHQTIQPSTKSPPRSRSILGPVFFFKLINPSPSLPACRRLLFPLLHAEKGSFPRATKEIGDVCTQAMSIIAIHIATDNRKQFQCPNILYP